MKVGLAALALLGYVQGDLIKSEGGCGGTPCIDDYDCGDGGPDSCVCDANGECLWIPQVQGDMINIFCCSKTIGHFRIVDL